MADPREGGNEDRTESPTPRRREKAREQGQVARSTDLGGAAALLAGTLGLAAGGAGIMQRMSGLVADGAHGLAAAPFTTGDAVTHLRGVVLTAFFAILPVAIGAAAGALAVDLVQTRGTLAWSRLQPQWSHLDPIGGFKRLCDARAFGRLLSSVLKLAALVVVVWFAALRLVPLMEMLPVMVPSSIASAVGRASQGFLVQTGLAFLVLGALDYGWQWWQQERGMKMSRQEVIDEFRESEGDPRVKARMQSLARERARQRMMQDVPTADVVVVNPTHIAVALRYDPAEAGAPVIVAMGQRKIAERIRAIASAAGVPVVQNKPVARALFAGGAVGRVIPPALYAAVAEILAFVYRQRVAAGRPVPLAARRTT